MITLKNKLILQENDIETIIQNNTKFTVPDNFNYIAARNLFKTNLKTGETKENLFNKMKLNNFEQIQNFIVDNKINININIIKKYI